MSLLKPSLTSCLINSRKFDLEFISRNNIAALTHGASEISSSNYVLDTDKKEVDELL